MSSRLPSSVGDSLPIAVLVSGNGTNLQALLNTVHGHEAEIVAVASNAAEAPALRRAAACGVPTRVFSRSCYADRQERDEMMAEWLQECGARLIVLAGFMELLSERFLDRFPDSVINVHPSLLPNYPGLHSIERALADRAKVFGVTIHYVDRGIDTGPVILQKSRRLPHAKDPAEVLKALRPLEHSLLPEAVRQIAAQRHLIAA
jgi:phosphoribosylglycinamide formyltransferase-1